MTHQRERQLELLEPTAGASRRGDDDPLLRQIEAVPFHGPHFDEHHDRPRLTGQLGRVLTLMVDGTPRSADEIVAALGNRDSATGIAARLRQARSLGYEVTCRRRSGGTFEYVVSPAARLEP